MNDPDAFPPGAFPPDAFPPEGEGAAAAPSKASPTARRTVSKATQRRRERAAKAKAEAEAKAAAGEERGSSAGRRKPLRSPKAGSARLRRGDDGGGGGGSGGDASSPASSAEKIYLTREELLPCSRPEKELRSAMTALRSGDWERIFDACNTVRRLAMHHGDVLMRVLHDCVAGVVAAVDNLRSSVSKNALIALEDMFVGLQRGMDGELDSIASALIRKATDTNDFLVTAAEAALAAMVRSATGSRVLAALLNQAAHRSSVIRARAARVTAMCVAALGNRVARSREMPRLLTMTKKFLGEGNADIRSAGRRIGFHLAESGAIDDDELHRLLDDRSYRKVRDLLDRGGSADALDVAGRTPKPMSTRSRRGRRTPASRTPASRSKLAGGGSGSSRGGSASSGSSGSASPARDMPSSTRSGGGRRTPSTRSAAPPRRRVPQLEVVPDLLAAMEGTDWRKRHEAMREIVDLTSRYPADIDAVPVLDGLASRLSDGNSKVNMEALRSLQAVVPLLAKSVEPTLPAMLPALATACAASSPKLADLAGDVFNTLATSVPSRALLPVLSNVLRHSNKRVKPVLTEKLSGMVPALAASSPSLMGRHVLPLSVTLLDSVKGGHEREACHLLVRTLYREAEEQMAAFVDSLPDSKRRRVMAAAGL
eukprot:PLAT12485.3.p2 GENE.PLAT12485.3~~PLAT12485.3.p2  ORF type:complete len:680 (+),score=377.10 PLAT12485.3:79-2040(+)